MRMNELNVEPAANPVPPPERRQGHTGIWTLSVANGDTVLALSEWGTQYEFERRAWEQLPLLEGTQWRCPLKTL